MHNFKYKNYGLRRKLNLTLNLLKLATNKKLLNDVT